MIDFASPLPAYAQVARSLRRRIRSGEWAPGDRIPTEVDIGAEYEVSRTTVREALSDLSRSGLVARRQGAGTFVRPGQPALFHDLSLPARLRDQFRQRGQELTSVLVPPPALIASQSAAAALGVGDEAELETMARVILIDGKPVALAISWFPASLVSGVTDEPLVEHSLTETLRTRYGLSPETAYSMLEALPATAEEAEHLETYPEAPLFIVVTTSHLPDGRAVEHSRVAWNADLVRFTVRHHVPSADPPS